MQCRQEGAHVCSGGGGEVPLGILQGAGQRCTGLHTSAAQRRYPHRTGDTVLLMMSEETSPQDRRHCPAHDVRGDIPTGDTVLLMMSEETSPQETLSCS
ncbi:unnamed protein product [Boreogadus saida]